MLFYVIYYGNYFFLLKKFKNIQIKPLIDINILYLFFHRNIVCTIWNKESHGLFDYESKNIRKFTIKIDHAGSLLKCQKEVKFVHENQVF